MTSKQYQQIEKLLARAEEITLEHTPLTPQGRKFQGELRSMLVLIVAEKYRAEKREGLVPNSGAFL